MANILIDGYNLIGIAHDNLEKARNELIQKLLSYSKLKKHQITLVFDGWKSGQIDGTKTKTANLTVIYSRLGEKADLTIIKKLSSSNKHWIVVSSDREISDYAAKKDHTAVSSVEFEEKLYSALDNLNRNSADDYVSLSFARRGGNPKKLSRKQKKKLQALRKL